MLAMREKYGSLILFDQIITVDEATTAFSSQDTEPSSKILKFVGNYRGDIENLGIVERFFTTELENHRLYCGDRLWLVFYVFRAVLARRAMLISSSFQKKEFRDWRHDSGIKQLLNSALPADFVNDVLSKDLNGLSTALARLEAEFLHEATKVMSGSKAIADSLADVQAIMQLQNAKVAERVK